MPEPLPDFHPEAHCWQVGPSRFVAIPGIGARLCRWDLQVARGEPRHVLHWPQGVDVPLAKVRGGNPILFPFAGRSYHKGTLGQWLDPLGEVRSMPQHGFAREGQFALLDAGESHFVAELQPTEADAQAYPGEYRFRVKYHFEELAFTVVLELINEGETRLPWSAGHHFYFTLPWHAGLGREHYRIVHTARKAFYHASDGRLQVAENFRPATVAQPAKSTFDEAALVDRILLRLRGDTVLFGPQNGEEDIRLTFADGIVPSPDAALVTWTESAESPFYCVEPWMGPPNAAGLKRGLHWVEPGSAGQFSIRVGLD